MGVPANPSRGRCAFGRPEEPTGVGEVELEVERALRGSSPGARRHSRRRGSSSERKESPLAGGWKWWAAARAARAEGSDWGVKEWCSSVGEGGGRESLGCGECSRSGVGGFGGAGGGGVEKGKEEAQVERNTPSSVGRNCG